MAHSSGLTWLNASIFSMNETQLRSAFTSLKSIRSSKIGVGGLRGKWTSFDVEFAGHAFKSVFYVKNGTVKRIEHVWIGLNASCTASGVFDEVVSELNSQLGPFDISDSGFGERSGQRSAVWTPDGTDLIVYLQDSADQCEVRVVNKPRVIKDASEL